MPKTEPSASDRKSARASQSSGKPTAPGKRNQSRLNGFVNSPFGKNPSSMRDNKPPALKISIAGCPGVQVDLATLPKGICVLDTETKLLKAMEDLYPLVSNHTGFKDNTRWSRRSAIADVFDAFFRKLLKLYSIEWGQIILAKGTYKLKIKEPVYFDVNCPVMPVYFIAELEQVDKKLFELFFHLVVFLFHYSHISLWMDDNDSFIFEDIEHNLAEYTTNGSTYGPEYQQEIIALRESYNEHGPKGAAVGFHARLTKAGASKRAWLKAFKEYQPKTAIQKDGYRLLQLGKELIEDVKSINDFISLPPDMPEDAGEYEEIPDTPDGAVKFVWRTDDYWFGEFESMVESINQNQGSLPFYLTKIIERAADFKEVENSYPAKLLRFMKAAREFEKKYRNVFRDPGKLKKSFFTKPKRLIDIL